jgi:hypothetical protein
VLGVLEFQNLRLSHLGSAIAGVHSALPDFDWNSLRCRGLMVIPAFPSLL